MRPSASAARALAAVAFATALGLISLSALDLVVGPQAASGKPVASSRRITVDDATLRALAAPLVLEDGSKARGLALGEITPLLGEAWALEASGSGDRKAWKDEALAERMYSIHLVEGEGPSGAGRGSRGSAPSWDLVVGRERFRAVSSIAVAGEVLEEDDLEVWLSWEGVAELKAEIARFAASHGVRIKAVEVPNTQTKFLAVARVGGRLPDLVMIQSDYVPAMAGGKLLQGVDSFRPAGIEAKGWEAFRSEGHDWAFPLYYDTQLVFYNRKLAGTPPGTDWTLDDLAARARALKGKIKAPMTWNAYSAYWLLPFMAGFGKDAIVDADGGITVDDAPTAKALETLLALRDSGLLEVDERDAMVSWFATGQAGYILSGSYSIPEFTRLGLDFGVAPYPLASKGGRPIAPLLDFKGLAVSRRSERPVLARRLAQDLTGQAFQARFTSALGKLPANGAALGLSGGSSPWSGALERSARAGIVIPPAPAYPVFKNTMWKILRFVFTGEMGVGKALGQAQALIDENLKLQ